MKNAHYIENAANVGYVKDAHTASTDAQQHSLLYSIWLHMLPGVLILLFCLIVGPLVIRVGLPPLLVPSLWVLFVLIPFELGFLLFQGKKHNGRLSLREIVLYREPMPVRYYLFLLPPLLLWAIVAFVIISAPTEPFIIKTLFSWLPSWFFSLFTISNTAGHTHTILLISVLLFMLTNPAAAFVEELYFRGYLLPRMAHLSGWAPLLNTVLFSLQHLFSPWQNLGRILAMLPMTYTVAWKKNIFIGIILHCTLDFLSAASLLLLLYR